MKFLVIGASGFIGRHILSRSLDMGCEAIGTRCRSGADELVPFDLLNDRIGERIDSSFWESDEPVFGVIAAALSQMERCLLEKETSRKINVDNTIRLVEDLRERGVTPVFLSTSFIFDGTVGNYPEEFPHSPISEYGRHKSEVDAYLAEHVPEALVLRLDKTVGDDPGEEHLFTSWRRCVEAGEPIVCIAGQLFSPTLAGDIAQAVMLACGKSLDGVYNAANGESVYRDELARQFLQILGKEVPVISKTQEELGLKELRPLKSCLDSTKLVEATGIRFTPMRDVMERFISRL